MEPLFKTTVSHLKELAEQRIYELEDSLKGNEGKVFRKISISNDIKEIEIICRKHLNAVTTAQNNIQLWKDDIDYLSQCEQDKEVHLTRQEWLHYVRGLPNLEWC